MLTVLKRCTRKAPNFLENNMCLFVVHKSKDYLFDNKKYKTYIIISYDKQNMNSKNKIRQG